jgi:hypothetical protein
MFRRLNGVAETTYYFEIKKDDSNKHLQWYYFLGQIIGKAFFDQCPVYFPVCKALYKMMLNRNYKLSLDDLKDYDAQMYNSLNMIASTELTDQELEEL